MRLIDADKLIQLMKERDLDCGNPKNAVDEGYSLAVKHMIHEIEVNNEYHCEIYDTEDILNIFESEKLKEHEKDIVRKFAINLLAKIRGKRNVVYEARNKDGLYGFQESILTINSELIFMGIEPVSSEETDKMKL